jgi:hypothetical protein
MEELQSDWAREGRSKGFIGQGESKSKQTLAELKRRGYEIETDMADDAVVTKNGEFVYIDDLPAEDRALFNRYFGDAEKMADIKDGVPYNPLLKDWQTVAVKKALRDAVDSKSDVFAWINGKQTSERYKLSTQVEEVRWKEDLGDREIGIKPKGQGETISFSVGRDGTIFKSRQNDWNGKKLDEVLGKGLADSIMSKESGSLSGEGLEFGGEWAMNLYDRQVRDIVKKLTGAEVKVADMGLGTGATKRSRFVVSKDNVQNVGELPEATIKDLKVGAELIREQDIYLVTDVMGDGKFKAINREQMKGQGNLSDQTIIDWANDNPYSKETFSLSITPEKQQYIELTPEVKAKILGKAPGLKKPSGAKPY